MLFRPEFPRSALSLVLMSTLASLPALAQSAALPDELPEVVAQGQLYSNDRVNLAFNVDVIDASDLAVLPVTNLADALEWVSGLDVRQRGSGGTQVDLGIRGAAYEQTLILVDGVRMNDPQSGHHNFDLPIVLEDIARIEVVRGAGSSQYGPNGNGGVINLVTHKYVAAEGGRKAGLKLEAGSKDYARGALTVGVTEGSVSVFASAAQQESDTYIKGAQLGYLTQQGNMRLIYDGDGHSTVAGVGYIDKGFGAEGFYTAKGAKARENTIQRHAYITETIDVGAASSVDLTVNWRQHDDEFFYKTFAPSVHQTNAWQTRLRLNLGDEWVIGAEHNQEDIESSSTLGDRHEREFSSLFVFGQHDINDLTVAGSLSWLSYDSGEEFVLPVLGLTWQANDDAALYLNAGKSTRVPSMNDLYLNQRSNKGNPDVKTEQTRSVELGVRWSGDVNVRAATFQRRSDDVIDYTRIPSQDFTTVNGNPVPFFKARNIERAVVKGFDLEVDAMPLLVDTQWQQARLSYTRLVQDFTNQFPEARYSKSQFEHQAILALVYEMAPGWSLSSLYKLEDRYNGDSYHIWDMGLKHQIKDGYWTISGTNLRDADYVDSGYIEAPGSGVKFELAIGI